MGDNSSVDENYLQEPDVEFNNGIVPIVDIDDSNTNNSLLKRPFKDWSSQSSSQILGLKKTGLFPNCGFSKTSSVSTLQRHLDKHSIIAPKKQKTLHEYCNDPHTQTDQKNRDEAVIKWIICDLQSINVVENEEWRTMISTFDSRYRFHNGQTIHDTIISRYEEQKNKVKISIQQIIEINYLSPEIDIVTRWNSTFYMLKKFIHLQPALQMLQVDNANVRRNYPMNEELQNVKDVTIMLEPIEHATKLLSASSYCTHGDVRFCFLSILEDLETHYNNDKFTQPMIANSIHHKLEEYWPFLDTSSQISSILDPCCKLSAFKEGEREDVKNLILQFNIVNSSTNDSQTSPLSELNRYLTAPLELNIDPLQ
ncbi:24618_t:CDS:2, partial [Entrophospora sp. SA101]